MAEIELCCRTSASRRFFWGRLGDRYPLEQQLALQFIQMRAFARLRRLFDAKLEGVYTTRGTTQHVAEGPRIRRRPFLYPDSNDGDKTNSYRTAHKLVSVCGSRNDSETRGQQYGD
jgi:hypothetical protein